MRNLGHYRPYAMCGCFIASDITNGIAHMGESCARRLEQNDKWNRRLYCRWRGNYGVLSVICADERFGERERSSLICVCSIPVMIVIIELVRFYAVAEEAVESEESSLLANLWIEINSNCIGLGVLLQFVSSSFRFIICIYARICAHRFSGILFRTNGGHMVRIQ